MDEIIFLLVIVSGALLIMPIVALVFANKARRRAEELGAEIRSLREFEARLIRRIEVLEAGNNAAPQQEASPPAAAAPFIAPVAPREFSAAAAPAPLPEPVFVTAPAMPPPIPQTEPVVAKTFAPPPPALPAGLSPSAESKPRPAPAPSLSLEQFMGAKLFAWVGGLALFLGVIFFVKLSIERGWISPELRTAIGFVIGVALLGAGVVIQRRRLYATLAHTLCATGTVVLYGVSYAAHSLYHIPPFHHALVTFGLMTLITAAAFLLAVRMEAQVVAVLGMLGGFLTPIFCSTGHDNPGGLFGYIALLDIGVLAVAKHKRWLYLTALAAAGTIIMQAGWMMKFFHSSLYAMGAATWIPVTVFLGFATLFMLAAWWSRQREDEDVFPAGAALSNRATAAPSRVADMTRIRRSSRSTPWASRASASPRSASRLRSWNSSKITAPTPSRLGSPRIIRLKTPSVTTSIRVRAETFDCMRTR